MRTDMTLFQDMIKLDKGSSDPLYRQIKEGLLAKIHSGAFPPDEPIPTERELAESLGLSRLTVRRSILELVDEGLVRRIRGRGTFIVTGAPKAPINAVAFVLSEDVPLDLGGPFLAHLLFGLHVACQPAFLSLRNVPQESTELKDCQGIVALWVLNSESLRRVTESGIPVVGYECPPGVSGPVYDTIGHDNEAGAFAAVSSLISLGHRDIGCVTQPTSGGLERKAGYERAMLKHGLKPTAERMYTCMSTGEAGYAFGRTLLAHAKTAPTALFCSDDLIANGVLIAMNELGLRCPDFMSIVGFGDLGLFCTPSLSSVRMDIRTSGRDAILLLKERAADPSLPARHHVLPTEFIRRASCGSPRSK
jgi:DNA-binding LacI/PurR family transcriptional regulator